MTITFEKNITATTDLTPKSKYNHYKMLPASQLSEAVKKLPVASMVEIKAADNNEDIKFNKAVRVTDETGKNHYVHFPTKRYAIVQHEQAFRPIVEGLTLAGVKDFGFVFKGTPKRYDMQIYATGEGYDTVSLGFTITNSFDGSTSVKYGVKMARDQSHIEVVGFRQVCSNGMKMIVPLDEAEIIAPVLRTRLTTIFSQKLKIRHSKSAEQKLLALQYVVEALSLLKDPVAEIIKRSQDFKIEDKTKLEELIKLHVGKRYAERVEKQFADEEQSLWGLYNAMTYVASHELKVRVAARDNLIDRAARMLNKEL